MTFMQPALPDDLDVYSWPLSYITWSVRSCDGAKHKIELYDSTSSQLAVNKTDGARRVVAANGGRSDAACASARRRRTFSAPAATTTASTGATPTPPRRAGFRSRRSAPARSWKTLRRTGPSARGRRRAHAARGRRRRARDGLCLRPGQRRRGCRPAAGDRGLRRNLRDQVFRQEAASLLGPQRREDRRAPANRVAAITPSSWRAAKPSTRS